MRAILLFAAAIGAVFSGGAAAQSEGRASVSAGYTVIDGDGAELGAITLRGGFDFTRHFGVEAEGHIGVVDEELAAEVSATPTDISLNHGLAAYGVARLPVAENGSNLFVRLGYATFDIEASGGTVVVNEDIDGAAFGVGGEFFFLQNQGLRLDYTRFEGDDSDADSYGASWVIRF